jgi:uncharacterized cupredoxin-like copper-binding protein
MRHAFPLVLLLLGATAAMAADAPPAAPVEVHLSEYVVAMPKALPAGPTTFVVHNDGRKTHSFRIEGPGFNEILSQPVEPQMTGELKVTLQPGEYKVYCPVGSHERKGMTTTLTVTPKPAG